MAKYTHPTRVFKQPIELENAWDGYKLHLSEEALKWKRVQYVGKEGNRVEDPQKVPLTLEGFKRYCRTNYGDVTEYFLNRNGLYDDFTTICSHIKEEIREDQIIGGLLGFYNPSITQRLNGLTEKQENKVSIEQGIFNVLDLDVPKDNGTQ